MLSYVLTFTCEINFLINWLLAISNLNSREQYLPIDVLLQTTIKYT